MHHQDAVRRYGQMLLAQPVHQMNGIGRLEQRRQCVAPACWPYALRDGQQMQVVIAQHTLHAVAHAHQSTQSTRRVGASVDHVTQNIQGIATGRKVELCQ